MIHDNDDDDIMLQLSRAQLAQLTSSGGQVLTLVSGAEGQLLTQVRLLDARETGVEVMGHTQ